MTKHHIPCDVIWLDIEYSNKKKYFTWDQESFPNARKMLDSLVADGRKLVTIIDPHVKHDPTYFVQKEVMSKELYVMDSTRKDPYVGHCWPSTSIWMDYLNPKCREYVKSLYSTIPKNCEDKKNYIWTDSNVHIWNDMNEPACFDPYDRSMAKSNYHRIGENLELVEHRDVHNVYGYFNV